MSSSIKDVACRAGVSIATVSRCYNNTGYVSEKTRTAVEEAANDLEFSPKKYHKRSVPELQSDVIGVIVADYANPFFASIVSAIECVMEKQGKSVLVCDSRESSSIELRSMELLRTRVSGLIIAPTSQVSYYNAEYIRELNSKVMPVVLIDRDINASLLDGVFVDSVQGSYKGIQSLIDNGHRHIAIIAGPTQSKPGLERLNGYLEALQDNGIPIRQEYILYGDFSEDQAYKLTKKVLENHKSITAIFASNISMSFGCIKAISDQKMKIPDDIAFVGFDDFPLFSMNSLNLSVLFNPSFQLGEEAGNWLIQRMERLKRSKEIEGRRIILTPELILRGSEKFPVNRL